MVGSPVRSARRRGNPAEGQFWQNKVVRTDDFLAAGRSRKTPAMPLMQSRSCVRAHIGTEFVVALEGM
jgi:hypothetical protein